MPDAELVLVDRTQLGSRVVTDVYLPQGAARLLATYLTNPLANEDEPTIVAALRRHAAEHLPDYMVPAAILLLDQLPRTANGKVNRKELPAPDFVGDGETYRAPRTPLEEVLCALFAEVLGVERVGIDDDFFSLGGHSLLAVTLVSRLQTTARVDLSLDALFDTPRIADLAVRLTGAADPDRLPLVSQPRPDLLPLSFAQQRLWFLHRLDPSSAKYHSPAAVRFEGPLDLWALTAALDDVVQRHESLRTRFPEVDGVPRQVIASPTDAHVPIEIADASAEDLRPTLALAATQPFDLTCELPIRAHVFELQNHDHVFLLVLHHIVCDAGSVGPLWRDLAAAYAARRAGEAPTWESLPVQYADYTLWQRRVLGDESDPDSIVSRQLAYWRETLADLPTPLPLPTIGVRPAVVGDAGAFVPLRIDGDVYERLTAMARTARVSTLMIVQAAVAALLTRIGAGTDIPLGTVITGRTHPAIEEMVGLFLNTVVVRVNTAHNPVFTALLDQVRAQALAAYAHADLPFERVVEALNPERSLGWHPLFQVLVAVDQGAPAPLSLAGLRTQPAPLGLDVARFDLAISLSERRGTAGPGGLRGRILYRSELFTAEMVEQIGAWLQRLLSAIAENPARRLSDADLLGDAERQQMLGIGLGVIAREARPTAPVLTVPAQVETHVARQPDAVAVVSGDMHVTYETLHARAASLGRALRPYVRGPEQMIGLAVDRGVGLPEAMLGIWAAQAAYVPLDLDAPPARLKQLVDNGLAAVVTNGAVPSWCTVPVVDVARVPAVAEGGEARSVARTRAEHAAYVIYTSGSTGEPKGVVIEHRQLASYVAGVQSVLDCAPGASVAVLQGLTFDFALTPVLVSLCTGGCLHVVAHEVAMQATALSTYLSTRRIEWTKFAPSHLRALEGGAARPALLPRVGLVLGGEAAEGEWVARLQATAPGCAVFNHYGPTETTVGVVMHRLPRARPANGAGGGVPLGRPLPHVRVYVLDGTSAPVPVGVAGEIYIAGAAVGRGYWRRSAQTAERFVADPYGPAGTRMYRTGDRGRWQADGLLTFLGRGDAQVKVRGYRVELGEVEAAVRAEAGVQEVVVTAAREPAGETRVLAYVVGAEVDGPALERRLAARVPSYLVPTVVSLPRLPLLANGKLDRKALPLPTVAVAAAARAPRTPIEEVLCRLFAEVLGLEHVGVDDDFFALGGHSLLAVELVSRLQATANLNLSLDVLFDAPRIADLAQRLTPTEADDLVPPFVPPIRPAILPLSFAQQRLWFLHRMNPSSVVYNCPTGIRIVGALDVPALSAAFDDVLARHESLRTRFPELHGEPVQQIVAIDDASLPLVTTQINEADVDEALVAAGSCPFNLMRELPIRAYLYRVAADAHVLLLVVHHIVSDFGSMSTVWGDLRTAYVARRQGKVPAWRPLPMQYADYAVWQRSTLGDEHDPDSVMSRQLAHWRDALAGVPTPLPLPTDRPRPFVAGDVGSHVLVRVDAATHARLADIAYAAKASLLMLLQSAVAALLTRLGAGTDIPLGTVITGRTHPATAEIVGLFLNSVVVRTNTARNPGFTVLLDQVRAQALAAYAHADVPFERVVEALNPERSLGWHPLFQVAVALESTAIASLELPDVYASAMPVRKEVARYDLAFELFEHRTTDRTPQGLTGRILYRCDLFERITIERLGRWLAAFLSAIGREPQQRIGALSLLSETEQLQILTAGMGDTRPMEEDVTVPMRIVEQTRLAPDAVAVVSGDAHLTYQSLRDRSEVVAATLCALGVGPEQVVGLAVDGGVALPVALLGIWTSGAAYLPLVPSPDRGHADPPAFDVAAVVTSGAVPSWCTVPVVDVARVPAVAEGGEARSVARTRAEHAAYVIYTSGSTGEPKGVVIEHRQLASYVAGVQSVLDCAPGASVAVLQGLTFDFALTPVLVSLCTGGCLHVVAHEVAMQATALSTYLSTRRIEWTKFAPSHLRALEGGAARPALLPRVGLVLGGEAAEGEWVARLQATAPGCAVFNHYGPTETTVGVVMHRLPRARPANGAGGGVPLGRPLPHVRVYVLDGTSAPVPVGVAGEIYIAGAAVGRGYWRRSAQTAERFVADPYGPAGTRMYRTGDRGRWQADGLLTFLGRGDAQVKVRGYRVELGEVEAAVRAEAGVQEVVVTAAREPAGETRVLAYVVGAEVDGPALERRLAARVPSYLVPTVVSLPRLPLLANGKLDRKALPLPTVAVAAAARAPRTPIEEVLCRLFAEVLGLEHVGVDDDFFALGGHSLLAIRLLSQVRALFPVAIPIEHFFSATTVSGLAALVAISLQSDTGADSSVPEKPGYAVRYL